MKLRRLFLPLFLGFFLGAFAAEPETLTLRLTRAFDDAWERGDLKALYEQFDPDCIYKTPFRTEIGRDAVRDHVFKNVPKFRNNHSTEDYSRVEGDLAYATGTTTFDEVDATGAVKRKWASKYLHVFTRRPGEDWKLRFHVVHEETSPAGASRSPLDLQPFDHAHGTMNEQEDRADTPRTGKVLLCLAGDSTVTYNAGYAAGLRSHFDKQLQVINRSRGGRTTASFRADGRWDDVLKIKPDYVMIQFGHNDTAAIDDATYAKNLARFVDEARAAGIKPILVTPVSRRYWQDDGTIKDDLASKVAAMRQVATDKNVPLMELHERAVDLYLKVGRKVSETWGLPKADPANPGVTILDKTHFNAEGSRAMGKVVADELKRVVPELAPYID